MLFSLVGQPFPFNWDYKKVALKPLTSVAHSCIAGVPPDTLRYRFFKIYLFSKDRAN